MRAGERPWVTYPGAVKRAIIAEPRRHGDELSPGTLYAVLHQLEEAGYLSRLDRPVSGKVRKY